MHRQPDFFQNLQAEFSSVRLWLDRAVVLVYAVVAGLVVVCFTLMTDWAFEAFSRIYAWHPWAVVIWTPLLTGAIVWLTRRYAPRTAGSGIPQVMAAMHPDLSEADSWKFVSLRLTFAKIVLSSLGFLAGLSIGREGPTVQIAAGVMRHAQRWLRRDSGVSANALLVAGGSAGIAAAFNAPLAGVVFAIEELSHGHPAVNNGLTITAIVLGGLMAVSAFGNVTYFGMIHVPHLTWAALGPGLLVAIGCGLAGGLFSRLLLASLTGSPDRISLWRKRHPVAFAMLGGLLIAVMGLVSGGASFGPGSAGVRHMLDGDSVVTPFFSLFKFLATWLAAWCGVPGGIFAPSLAIGAGIGHDIAMWTGNATIAAALIAMGMTAFLAAVTQAPLTAFIIVMEMVDGHAMVLSLMAAGLIGSLVSRMLCRPLYPSLALAMVRPLLPRPPQPSGSEPEPDAQQEAAPIPDEVVAAMAASLALDPETLTTTPGTDRQQPQT